jgi:CMP-2-keto-3-deoxyoctulosonic acid synthetase
MNCWFKSDNQSIGKKEGITVRWNARVGIHSYRYGSLRAFKSSVRASQLIEACSYEALRISYFTKIGWHFWGW